MFEISFVDSLSHIQKKRETIYLILSKTIAKGYEKINLYDIYFFNKNKEDLFIEESYKVLAMSDKDIEKKSKLRKKFNPNDSFFLGQIQNERAYRKILNFFDMDEKLAKIFLLSINDAGLLEMEDKLKDNYLFNNELLYSELLRNKEAYYAHVEGIKVLYKKENNEIYESQLLFKEKININLEYNKNKYSVKLNYIENELFPSNINIFVGPNGSGKSYTIKNIIDKLFNKNTQYQQENLPLFNKVLLLSNTYNDNYRATKKSTDSVFQKRSEYHYVNLINQKKFDLYSGVTRYYKTGKSFKEIFQKEWYESAYTNKLELLNKHLKKIIEFDHLLIPTNNTSQKFIRFEDIKIHNLNIPKILAEIDITQDVKFLKNEEALILSSGQDNFVRFIFYILASIEQRSLIIVDEPENFLHPSFEISFFRMFNELLKDSYSFGLIATHSSVIVREIPSKNVHIFDNNRDRIINYRPEIETFGNNLHKISTYIFKDIQEEKTYYKAYEDMVKDINSIDELFDKLAKKLDPDVLSLLSSKFLNNKGTRID